MKKTLLIIQLIFFSLIIKAQYPVTQNLGNNNTLISLGPAYGGAIRGNHINGVFADTTAANLSPISFYAGAQIFTTIDTSFWIRNKTSFSLYWFRVGGAGGGASGNAWLVSGDNIFPVTVPARYIGTSSLYGGGVGIQTNGIPRLSVDNAGIPRVTDAKYKFLVIDTEGVEHFLGYEDGGSGSTGWLLTGNSGTTAGTNFIGTIDSIDFVTKINNVESGRLSPNGQTSLGYHAITYRSSNYAFNRNTAIGYYAMSNNISVEDEDTSYGYFNTAIGYEAMKDIGAGSANVAVGNQAMKNGGASLSVAIGDNAMGISGGSQSVAIGSYALKSGGSSSIAIGYNALPVSTSGSTANIAIGVNAMLLNTTGSNNIAIGQALRSSLTSSYNIAIGDGALDFHVTGSFNTVIGVSGLSADTSGELNTVVGYHAMISNKSGSANAAFGNNALLLNTTGFKNTAIGAGSLENNTTGYQDAFVGEDAGLNNITGINNNGIGWLAGSLNENGNYNNYFGTSSGRGQKAGNYNIFIGHEAGYSGTQEDTISNSIGLGARAHTVTNNQFVISDSITRLTFPGVSRGVANYVLTDSLGNGQYWVARPTSTVATAVPISGLTAALADNTVSLGSHYFNLTSTYYPNGGFWYNGSSGVIYIGDIAPDHNETLITLNDASGLISMVAQNGVFVNSILYGSSASNGDLRIKGTSNATKTTSYVTLQEDGGLVGIGISTPDSLLHNAGSFHQVGNAKFDAKIHAPNLAAGAGTKAVRWDATNGFVLADTTSGGGYTNLTQFVDQTAWRSFYSNGSGDVQELPFGTSGKVFTSSGTTSAPTWETPTGGAIRVDQLLAMNTTNDIDNVSYKNAWRWNSLAGDTAQLFEANTTAAASNAQVGVAFRLAGANANASQTTSTVVIENNHTGTTPNGIGLTIKAPSSANLGAGIFITSNAASDSYTPVIKMQATDGSSASTIGNDYAGSLRFDGGDLYARFGTFYTALSNMIVRTYAYSAAAAPNNYTVNIRTPEAAAVGLMIDRGAASQTGNYLEFRRETNAILARFDSLGNYWAPNLKSGVGTKAVRWDATAGEFTVADTTVGGGLTVGTSAIASGTGGRVLYETSGNVLGEISGATSDGTTLTLVAPVLGAATGTSVTLSGLMKSNALNFALQSIATAAGTTTLTLTSPFQTIFTGATTQNCDLPDATTLAVGHRFKVSNNSTGLVTVRTNGGATFWILGASTDIELVVTDIGTAAGTWEKDYRVGNNATGKVATFNSTSTWTGTDAQTYTFPTTTATIARTDAAQTFTGIQSMTSPKITTDVSDANGNEVFKITATGSAVNEITLANAATTNNPSITASGETNVGLVLSGKGTRGVIMNNAMSEKTVTVADGAGAVIDCSLGNVFTWTAAADRTAGTTTNPTSGQKIIICFIASGANRTLTLPTATTGDFAYGADITTLTATTSAKGDMIGCVYGFPVANRWNVVSYSKTF